jgi:predicted nucleotidyltransferase
MMKGKGRADPKILALLRSESVVLRKYGVRRIGVFGSYARGRPRPTSDVDLVVEFEQPSFDNFIGLTEHLERLLGKRVEILTSAGLAGIRIKEVAKSIRQSLVYV